MPTRTGSRAWVLGTLCVLAAGTARAASDPVEFYAQLDRNHIGADEAVTLEVTLALNENREPEKVVLPSGPDFDVVSQNRSDQMSFAMGGGGPSFRRVRVYTLMLHPHRQGKLSIDPGFVVVNGKRTETGKLQVDVGPPGTGAPLQARRPGTSPFGTMPGMPSAPGFPQLPGFEDDDTFDDLLGKGTPPSDRDVSIRATVDHSDPFVGQQVTLTLHLVSRQPLSGVQNLDTPQLDAFWSEELESPTQLAAQQRTIEGVPYFVYLLRRKAIFPLRDGELTIPPIGVTLTAGASFFGSGVTVERKSQPIVLHVKPLPPGAPPDFVTGSVGHYTVATGSPATSASVGDPVSVTFTIEGTGNLRQLEIPHLPRIDGLRAYDPTHTDELAAQAGKWGGKRTLETVLVPERAGTFTVPAVRLPVFDPDTGAYQTLESRPVSFTIVPRVGGPAVSATGGTTAQPSQGDGLREIRPVSTLEGPGKPLYARPWYLALLLLPALVLFGSVVGPRLSRIRLRPRDARRTAGKEARRRLAAALRLSQSRDARFWVELDRALHAYLTVRLGRPTSGLTRDDLAAALAASAAPPEAIDAVRATLDACDAGRFAPGALDAQAAERALAAASTAIDDLEEGTRGIAA